jgi:photosystem II stability/assembly factor-like uncharacterized protein
MRKCKEIHRSIYFVLRFFILFCLASMMAAMSGFAGEDYISIQALAVDASAPQTLYAGTSSGVFKSMDGGSTWKEVNNESLTKASVLALAVDASAPQTLYAATEGGDLFKSTDGGKSWKTADKFMKTADVRIDPSLPQTIPSSQVKVLRTNMEVRALVIDPKSPKTVYAVTSFGVLKSANGGNSWTPVTMGLRDIVYSLAIDPSSPQTLYAGGENARVFKSTDGGSSWAQINTNRPANLYSSFETWAKDPLKDPSRPPAIDDDTREKLRETLRIAAEKDRVTGPGRGLTGNEVLFMTTAPSSPQTLYAVTSGHNSTGGVFRSTDGGSSWTAVNKGMPEFPKYAQVVIAPSLPQTMYAFSEPSIVGPTSGGVFKSTDGGIAWTPVNNGLPKGGVRSLAIDPSSPQTIYAGSRAAGMFKSTDGGIAWTPANNGLRLQRDTVTGQAALATSQMPAPQRVYCEQSYTNFAWGAVHNGVYVDPEGNLYRYSYSKKEGWQPLTSPFGPEENMTKITEQKLEDYYSQYEKKLVRQINPEEWQAKRKLLNETSTGNVTGTKGCGGNDMGEILDQCFVYNEKDRSYRKVKFRMRGNSCNDNSSPSAKELADWLDSLKAEAFPQPKLGQPFPTRGGQ